MLVAGSILHVMAGLLSFLHARLLSPSEAIDVCLIRSFPAQALHGLPALSDCWRGRLIRHQRVNSVAELAHRPLYEAALTVASADEDCVDGYENPASLCKDDGGEENAEPEGKLE